MTIWGNFQLTNTNIKTYCSPFHNGRREGFPTHPIGLATMHSKVFPDSEIV